MPVGGGLSRINKSLDALLQRFAQHRLDEAYPYVIFDARYEKVQAVFIALGINEEGRRQVLGVELSNRESQSSWTTFVKGLKTRGLHGVEFVVSDDHAGIKRAVRELLPEAVWQRCYVHFLRNALDYLPRKADDDCRQELRWFYDRRNLKEAQQDLQGPQMTNDFLKKSKIKGTSSHTKGAGLQGLPDQDRRADSESKPVGGRCVDVSVEYQQRCSAGALRQPRGRRCRRGWDGWPRRAGARP